MSNISNSEGITLLNELKRFVDKIFKKKMESLVQVASATVVSVDESDNVTVRLASSASDGSQDFIAANQSGSTLSTNDVVTLFYWGTYTTACIFIKN